MQTGLLVQILGSTRRPIGYGLQRAAITQILDAGDQLEFDGARYTLAVAARDDDAEARRWWLVSNGGYTRRIIDFVGRVARVHWDTADPEQPAQLAAANYLDGADD